MAKKKKAKTPLNRDLVIAEIVADVETWEDVKGWAREEWRRQVQAMPNEDLLLELDKAYPGKYEPFTSYEVVGEFKSYEKLLELIAEEADEHENQVNDVDGAVAAAEHRGTDFQEALAIVWKLLTPEQRKKAFLEFKETHDFAAYDKKEVE